jgi:hypothetical protein
MNERAHVDGQSAKLGTRCARRRPRLASRWGGFALLCLAYFVATTGEQMLSPLFPMVADDLGISPGGIACRLDRLDRGLNLVGGAGLRRMAPVT